MSTANYPLERNSKIGALNKFIFRSAYFLSLVSIASLPLTGIFAWGQFLTIPMCSALLGALFGLAAGIKINKSVLMTSGALPLSLLAVSFISFLWDSFGEHSSIIEIVNVFRINIFLVIYACCLGVIFNIVKFSVILRALTIGVLFSTTFGLFDFLLQNLTNLSFDQIFYRYLAQDNPGTLGPIFRVRSTFVEPGLYAFFLAILGPWALLSYQNKSSLFRALLIFSIGAAFVLTFSAAGYIIFLFLTFLLAIRGRRLIFLTPAFLAVLLISTPNFIDAPILTDGVALFISKYDVSSNDASLVDRSSRIEAGIELLKDGWSDDNVGIIFLGRGPGWVSSNFIGAGLVNTYLYIMVEFGIIGLISLIIFFVVIWWKYVRKQSSLVFYSFFSLLLSLFFIQNYYEIMVIFALALIAFNAVNKYSLKEFIN